MAGFADSKDESSNIAHVASADDSTMGAITKTFADASHTDAGLDNYRRALDLDPDHLEALSKKVLRKLDFILLPLVRRL